MEPEDATAPLHGEGLRTVADLRVSGTAACAISCRGVDHIHIMPEGGFGVVPRMASTPPLSGAGDCDPCRASWVAESGVLIARCCIVAGLLGTLVPEPRTGGDCSPASFGVTSSSCGPRCAELPTICVECCVGCRLGPTCIAPLLGELPIPGGMEFQLVGALTLTALFPTL